MKCFDATNFDLQQELTNKGTKEFGFIELAKKPDGNSLKLPVMIVCGAQDGPTVVASACVHGDEYEGAQSIVSAYHCLDPQTMKGNFVGVPAVNMEAFNDMKRYASIDFVPVDLNRSMPGNPKGPATLTVADYYIENIVKKADGLITMHGGGNYLYIDPVVLYQNYGDEISAKSKEMAKAFGVDFLWQNSVTDPSGGIEDELAYTFGIPAVCAEFGGQSTRQKPSRDAIQETAVKGILNVLSVFDILDTPVATFDNQCHVALEYLFCNNGGFCNPQFHAGEKVKEGDVLAVITDIFGETIEELKAPYDGVIVGYWAYAICQPKSWIYMIGKEVSE